MEEKRGCKPPCEDITQLLGTLEGHQALFPSFYLTQSSRHQGASLLWLPFRRGVESDRFRGLGVSGHDFLQVHHFLI